MGKSSSTPAAPDPKELARLQGIEDRKAQRINLDATRTSTVNPFGKTRWVNNPTFDQAGFDSAMKAYGPDPVYAPGDEGILDASIGGIIGSSRGPAPDRNEYMHDAWTNIQELSPESQGIYDTATAKLGDATKNISTNTSAYNQTVADAIQRRMSRYMDPELAQARSAMQSNLADRGFQVGNEGYNNEMTRLDDSQNQARADIADRAQITGASQGLQELSMQQQIAQALQGIRQAQVSGVASMPSTTTASQVNPYDISGAMMQNYQAQLQQSQANTNSQNALLGAGLQAAGMYFGGPVGGALASGVSGSLLPQTPQMATPDYSMSGALKARGGRGF